MGMKGKRLVIVRTGGSVIDFESYNCQELGLAKALSKRGVVVSLVLAGKENKLNTVDYEGYAIKVYQRQYKSVNQSLAWFDNIEALLREIGPDIVQIHEFGMLMSWRVVRWAEKNGIPAVLIQGSYRPTQKVLYKQLELLFNITFGRYILSKVLGIGSKTLRAERYIKEYTNKKVFPTPIGLDVSKFENGTAVDWRERLDIPQDKKIILYVGVLEPRRNPFFLIEILECLPEDYVLVVAGDGILLEDFREKTNQESVKGRCRLAGKVPQKELPSLYSQSDIFVLVSDYEIYGMVMLETMYFGTPVISTVTAGSESVVSDGSDGLLMNEKTATVWADKIKMITTDHELYERMSVAAKVKIGQNLVWEHVAEQYLKLYSSVVAQSLG